ncbi:MAG: STAS domain-containing protein [Planctomycetota bacterium]|nr:STAS domain-containing protein [Planctomycetota bacterium]
MAPPEELTITETTQHAVVILSLDGPVSVKTFEQLDKTLHELFHEGHYRIILDMAMVLYVSSAGAGVFMNALSLCRENDGNIVLINITESVAEVLDLLNLTNILPTAKSLDLALASFNHA